MSFLDLLKIEFMKVKRSKIVPLIFIAPLLVNIINLRLDITHLYYPAKNSFQKGRLKRREIFTELLLYTLTT